MLVIPAVDIKGGKCVRLLQGRADQETVYGDDPVAMAKRWQNEGAELLHVVDLDGAFEGRRVNSGLIERIVTETDLRVEVGGGIRTDEAAEAWLDVGVERVVVGTRAVESPDWARALCTSHPNRIVLGIDARDGMVAVKGWTSVSKVRATEFVREFDDVPLAAVVFTDIARDGMLSGPNVESTGELAAATRHPVIASGGIASLEDIRALSRLPIEGMITGKALYAGQFGLVEAVAMVQAARG